MRTFIKAFRSLFFVSFALCLTFSFPLGSYHLPVYAAEPETTTIRFQIFSVKRNYITDYESLTLDSSLPAEQMFAQGFQTKPADPAFNATLKPDAGFNRITVTEELLELDCNAAFEQHGYGSGAEVCMLRAVVNTLGNHYGVPFVKLTVEGRAYDAGHGTPYADNLFPVEPFPGVVFSGVARVSDEGLQNDFVYTFAEYVMNPSVGEPLLLVNGVFAAQAQGKIEIMGGRAFAPLDFLTDQLGAFVSYDRDSGKIDITTEDTEIAMTLAQTEALVNHVPAVLDASPIERNGMVCVPLRFVAEQTGHTVGYDPGYRIANPIIWLDRISYATEPPAAAVLLKECLTTALQNGKIGNIGGDYESEFTAAYPQMAADIDAISYCGQMGRFAVYTGYRIFLVDLTSNEIYYIYTGNAYGGIGRLDVGDIRFFHGYFAG